GRTSGHAASFPVQCKKRLSDISFDIVDEVFCFLRSAILSGKMIDSEFFTKFQALLICTVAVRIYISQSFSCLYDHKIAGHLRKVDPALPAGNIDSIHTHTSWLLSMKAFSSF